MGICRLVERWYFPSAGESERKRGHKRPRSFGARIAASTDISLPATMIVACGVARMFCKPSRILVVAAEGGCNDVTVSLLHRWQVSMSGGVDCKHAGKR